MLNQRMWSDLEIVAMPDMTNKESGCWSCGSFKLSLEKPLVMGILNVTPDSFSDGGRFFERDVAVEQAVRMVRQGADIIDVGGESTRPGAAAVSVEDELSRVIPVVKALAKRIQVPISIDTRHADVASNAVSAGASIINNIMPLTEDAAMARVAAESGAGLVVMHMRGTPLSMNSLTVYEDVVTEVFAELKADIEFAIANGVSIHQIVVDPGIGFAKELTHNLELLAALDHFMELAPVLVGVSRKRFIGELCCAHDSSDRIGGSLGAAVWCALHGASVLRVHDVKENWQALSVVDALLKIRRNRDVYA